MTARGVSDILRMAVRLRGASARVERIYISHRYVVCNTTAEEE